LKKFLKIILEKFLEKGKGVGRVSIYNILYILKGNRRVKDCGCGGGEKKVLGYIYKYIF
jgi:Fe2+ or Zn2+ uptake regulation protein